jgi:orotate phosphoribosyltransferase
MKEEIQDVVSALLWETSAVKVSVEEPFTIASGNRSPIYVDCRVLISYPWARGLVTACAQWLVEAQGLEADYLAGGETAGIPYGAWLAERLGKPFVYVRKEPKGHGLGAQIEGALPAGKRVLLCEDLVTDGKSKLTFIEGIRGAECEVTDCIVVFDRQQGGAEVLRETGVTLHGLSNLERLLDLGARSGRLSREDLASIQTYLADPETWHTERGYPFRARL